MVLLDLHDWSLTALFAALLATSLTFQNLPADHSAFRDAGVCEKPGIPFLPFH
jgi:hypothetical protein